MVKRNSVNHLGLFLNPESINVYSSDQQVLEFPDFLDHHFSSSNYQAQIDSESIHREERLTARSPMES